MSGRDLEAFLARLLVDDALRARFFADPDGEGILAGLTESERAAVRGMDRTGLELAARSVAAKRRGAGRRRG